MPTYTVRRRVDAYVNYVTQVDAHSPLEAAEQAGEEDGDLVWQDDGTDEFDARLFITLDDDGFEIEDSEVRYF